MVAVIIDPMITDYFDNRQCIKETQKITKYCAAGPILPIPMDNIGYFVNCLAMDRPTHKWRLALLETEVHVPNMALHLVEVKTKVKE